MTDKKKFKQLFSEQLAQVDCVRKSNAWYKESKETIFVVELQKSNYDESYFLNLAIWLKILGENKFPKERFCHIRTRAGSFFFEYGVKIANILDFNNASLDEERCEAIQWLLTENVIPLIKEAAEVKGLCRLYQAGKLKKAFIHKDAREILLQST
ncbi:MAG: DUF4304 domain-containing protein [bacterium]|nr:DUF4304 domain-containing protein [bacterium]